MVPELLAPAGSPDALKAAISAGADAVYLGGERFGARFFAENFDQAMLRDAVDYAHIRGVKVYVTVNTLVHDSELKDLGNYLHILFCSGVDALIIQDIGVLSYAKSLFADIPGAPALHASTQMTVHNREGAVYACSMGCKRIVLSRELSLSEIRDIADSVGKYNAEVEIFIHGALCYAYSGQCLLSSVIGGRSGNRGMCAQPCRKRYELLSGKQDEYGRIIGTSPVTCSGQYLMSTRDLSVYRRLSDIAELPVTSLKIEGRMRSASYVAIVTHIYKKSLESIRKGTFIPSRKDELSLALAFNRGFTSGYLNGEGYQTVMGRSLPGRQGILIGTVKRRIIGRTISVHCSGLTIPRKGDGLVCIGDHDEQGFVLRNDPLMKGKVMEVEASAGCLIGDQVFLTNSADISRFAEQIIKKPDKKFHNFILLEVSMNISQDGNVQISGKAFFKNGRKFTDEFILEQIFSQARSQPITKEQIVELLGKTGGTLFSIKLLQFTCPSGMFAPISVINKIRRDIISRFTKKIISSYHPSSEHGALLSERIAASGINTTEMSLNRKKFEILKIIIIVSDSESLENAYCAGADLIYVEWYPGAIKSYNGEKRLLEILDTVSRYPDFPDRIGIKLPKIIRREELDYLYERLPILIASGIRHILVDGIGIADTIRKSFNSFTLSGYTGLNITNYRSLSVYRNYDLLTLSVELSGEEVLQTMSNAMSADLSTPVAVMGQGLIEAMITEDRLCELCNDPSKRKNKFGLKDQKGLIFPVIEDPLQRTHIFNAAETSLIDYIPVIRRGGIYAVIIDARWRGPTYTGQVTGIWREAASIPENFYTGEKMNVLKEKLKIFSYGGLTSATWKRGLSFRS